MYDLLIVGGGLVGASLAIALSGQGLRLALIEARPLSAGAEDDERAIALAYGSRRIFDGLGLWPRLAPHACSIRRIHISERGGPGVAWLEHRDAGVEALGYVIEARHLAAKLAQRLAELPDVELCCPARVETVSVTDAAATVVLEQDGRHRQLEARLLVAADGARSRVREQLGIPALHWDYGQSAVIANIVTELPHQHIAYERFTEDGPLALLPLGERRMAVVCTVAREQIEAVLALSDDGFLELVRTRFGERLGRFLDCGRRQTWPLALIKAREHDRPRLALIGNAAHTLHPIAGQGFNLGLRDAAALAEVVSEAQARRTDPGAAEALARYADWRRWDQRHTIAFTDVLTRLFGLPVPPLRIARNLGLIAFDLLPGAKHWLARRSMGLDGRLPRLAQGLPLLREVAS
ncbi:MAG TPA: 2-octaprenyl-6-methoxyphenyl hydroxylase [Candidatus Competibacteraceae bacterium]|nr:2-octaprenyl-6-methoxyphenyl hydroxylase [Candidatus Competibacteraceae bacterium]